jgi:hypothetical protein
MHMSKNAPNMNMNPSPDAYADKRAKGRGRKMVKSSKGIGEIDTAPFSATKRQNLSQKLLSNL